MSLMEHTTSIYSPGLCWPVLVVKSRFRSGFFEQVGFSLSFSSNSQSLDLFSSRNFTPKLSIFACKAVAIPHIYSLCLDKNFQSCVLDSEGINPRLLCGFFAGRAPFGQSRAPGPALRSGWTKSKRCSWPALHNTQSWGNKKLFETHWVDKVKKLWRYCTMRAVGFANSVASVICLSF